MIIKHWNPWFKVVLKNNHYFLQEKGSGNGAVILIVDEKDFIFVMIKRPAHNQLLIECPRGYGELTETSAQTAIRELLEETGYKISERNLHKLGSVKPNSAILSTTVDVFFAKVDQEHRTPSHDNEITELYRVPITKMKEKVANGEISDGFTLSALALYWAKTEYKE